MSRQNLLIHFLAATVQSFSGLRLYYVTEKIQLLIPCSFFISRIIRSQPSFASLQTGKTG